MRGFSEVLDEISVRGNMLALERRVSESRRHRAEDEARLARALAEEACVHRGILVRSRAHAATRVVRRCP